MAWLPRWDRGKWSPGYIGSIELPDSPADDRDTSAADWGTALHDAKANNAEACDPWLSAVDPVRDSLWPPSLGFHERAYSYNCRTGVVTVGPTNRELAEMDAWKASQPVECVVGTADWVATLPAGEWWVDDLKSGMLPAVDGPAMLFYGLCAHRTGASDTGRLSITHWPRSADPAGTTPERHWLQVGFATLDAFAEEVNKAWRLTNRKSMPTVKSGPHCEYCPSIFNCPASKPGKE